MEEAVQPARASRGRAWARLGRIIAQLLPFVLASLVLWLLRAQLPRAVVSVRSAHPIALCSIALFFAWNQLATLCWQRLLVAAGVRAPPLGTLVRLRIETQAVNQLVPTGGLAGEALRAVRAAEPGQIGAASMATVLDNAAGTFSGLVFALSAVSLHLYALHGNRELAALLPSAGAALGLLVALVFLPFYLAPRWQPHLRQNSRLRELLDPFTRRGVEVKRAFGVGVGLRFVERLLGAAEVFVLFRAVGAPVSLGDAALLSAVFEIVSFTVFFVPGQLGAAEGAVVAGAAFLGIPAALALSAALLRRARQLFVCVLGVVLLLLRRSPLEAAL